MRVIVLSRTPELLVTIHDGSHVLQQQR